MLEDYIAENIEKKTIHFRRRNRKILAFSLTKEKSED